MASDDADGLTSLFVQHYAQLLRTATLLVGDIAAGEDIVQEAYVRVSSIVRRDGIEVGVGYLQRTVVNLARSDLRRRMVALRHAPKIAPDRTTSPDTALALIESSDVIDALRSLSRRQREAVVLRYCDDRSEAETAEIMGVSRGAVKNYASRGLAALRALLGDES